MDYSQIKEDLMNAADGVNQIEPEEGDKECANAKESCAYYIAEALKALGETAADVDAPVEGEEGQDAVNAGTEGEDPKPETD